MRAGWEKRAARTARMLREVCRPRGGHRRSGETRETTMGDTPRTIERCADCGAWAVVDDDRPGIWWTDEAWEASRWAYDEPVP